MKILLVDDDVVLCQQLKQYLEKFDFQIDAVHDGRAGVEIVKKQRFDAMILDYMLPDNFDGLAVCREVKTLAPRMPVLMLSARGDSSDKIIGLEMGADDYLAKPFEPRELVARLKALGRRPNIVEATIGDERYIKFDKLTFDVFTKCATLFGENIALTSAEYALLEEFAKKPGKVFNRDELCRALKGFDWQANDRSLDIVVSKLRQKLKDDLKSPRYIKTVWGSGYMFIGGATPA